MFAGLAWASGYVESIPNFELLTVITFVGGWVLGPRWGAIPGGLGELLFSTINPYGLAHPLVLASQVVGMALSGVAGGALGRADVKNARARWVLVVLAGIAVTIVYDLLTNVASGIAYGQMATTLKLAIPFTLAHVGTNAALFATVGVLLVNALERTRRSLLAALFLIMTCTGVAQAQTPVEPSPTPVAPPPPADSLAKPQRTPAEMSAAPDTSVAYRDLSRSLPPTLWGLGPSHLLRRDDGTLAVALTREGAFSERFADDRGSAEPLGRFGLAGSNRVLIDWLGLPVTGASARSGETLRVPWNAVATFEGPRLPVSSVEPYRGELGAVTLEPFTPVRRHPRVEAWASLGDPSMTENGFSAAGKTHRWDGFLAVDAATLSPLEPLGPEGHHGFATRLAFADGYWTVRGTYRVARQSIEDLEPRYENRGGEAGALDVEKELGSGARASLRLERTQESFDDATEALGLTAQRGKGGRATARLDGTLGGRDAFAAFTYGQETLESEGTVAFEKRRANLWWGTTGIEAHVGDAWIAKGSLGAGSYGGDGFDVAPSLLLESDHTRATAWWGGVARGLTAALDPRFTDADGDTVGDVTKSSTWLLGVGLVKRAGWDRTGGSWRDPAPRGALTLRTAVYAGRATPSFDPPRDPLAGPAIEAPTNVEPDPTKFVAWTGNARWSPRTGLTLDGGAHAIARELSGFVQPGDPELRAYGTIEGRHRFGDDGPDARLSGTVEWIGPRDPFDLPAATRFGLNGGVVIDEFEIHARWQNVGGSNRLLPVPDPLTSEPLEAAESRFRVEVRWTFWD